jgi:hypothetical protein
MLGAAELRAKQVVSASPVRVKDGLNKELRVDIRH